MDITELLEGGLSSEMVKGIADKAGVSQESASSVIKAASPVLLGMLGKNASTEKGAASLLGALNDHDGSIFNHLSSFLNSDDTADGMGILGHVLGNNQDQVVNHLSQKTGVSSANVSKIITMLAPIVLGYLGRKSRTQNVNTGGGLSDLLGGLLGGGSSSSIGTDILGSLLGGGSSQTSKKGTGGSLLGTLSKILGKK